MLTGKRIGVKSSLYCGLLLAEHLDKCPEDISSGNDAYDAVFVVDHRQSAYIVIYL